MYKGQRILVLAPAYNEEVKIGEVVRRMPMDLVDTILVIDDGSTDRSAEVARERGAEVLSMGRVLGVGAALRKGIEYGLEHKFDIILFIAGNNKDDPSQVIDLVKPIVDDGYDFVMGSRYLAGGEAGNMPLYRRLSTKLHPLLFSLIVGKRLTESTNGFRAFRASLFQDKRLNLWQDWLDQYELEPYMLFKTIRLGYKHTEVPVRKVYPPKAIGYTKMKPITGWWSILRPIVLLGLGIKR
jgi:dolichol-phosphate mannosyltransferase